MSNFSFKSAQLNPSFDANDQVASQRYHHYRAQSLLPMAGKSLHRSPNNLIQRTPFYQLQSAPPARSLWPQFYPTPQPPSPIQPSPNITPLARSGQLEPRTLYQSLSALPALSLAAVQFLPLSIPTTPSHIHIYLDIHPANNSNSNPIPPIPFNLPFYLRNYLEYHRIPSFSRNQPIPQQYTNQTAPSI